MTNSTTTDDTFRPGPTARRSLSALAALCLILASCSSDGQDVDTSASSVSSADTTLDDSAAGESSDRTVVTTSDVESAGSPTIATTLGETDTAESDTAESDTATETATDEPDGATEPGGVPGEPLDFGPPAGTPLAVVGVAYDDTLNFRVDPSPSADIAVSHGPLSDDLDTSALGSSWAAPSSVWWMVDVGGTTAWANQAFLGSLGTPATLFDQVSAELDTLQFETVEAAALAVADLRASDDPQSDVVFAGEPSLFEAGGFAVVDVMGLGDDAVKGERIRIDVEVVFDEDSGEEGAQDVAFVVLTEVEIAPICSRGLSGGLCL